MPNSQPNPESTPNTVSSDIPVPDSLNKSAIELAKYNKADLASMLVETNTFIVKHLINENFILKERIGILERVSSFQSEALEKNYIKIKELETLQHKNDQYSRELNVEFAGIPELIYFFSLR